jgi:hypothetical protein
MKLGIMQPYLFPYIGYFSLISKVDKFVFLDDVNYIKRGWINRNRLIFSGQVSYFTIPLESASQNNLIYEIKIHQNNFWQKKLKKTLFESYKKAPFYKNVSALFEEVLFTEEQSLSEVAKTSIIATTQYLGIPHNFVLSSSLYKNTSILGQDRILDICLKESAEKYWNLPGGRELYSLEKFKQNKIALEFVEPNFIAYPQFSKDFNPGLSIIDVMMHNSIDDVRSMLQ